MTATLFPDQIVGDLVPIGTNHILGLYEHPKLVCLETGRIVQEWKHISLPKQHSSIVWGKELPYVALDPALQRVAIGHGKTIHILQFNLR